MEARAAPTAALTGRARELDRERVRERFPILVPLLGLPHARLNLGQKVSASTRGQFPNQGF
jgi:hypothetical protein